MGEIIKHNLGTYELVSAVCQKCNGSDYYQYGNFGGLKCRKCDLSMKIESTNATSMLRTKFGRSVIAAFILFGVTPVLVWYLFAYEFWF